jgi:molybdenum cofactor cytidylyltransferase
MRTGCIILAAGNSSRLGEPKQLVRLQGGKTLLERAVRVASGAGCAPIVVVLGANADRILRQCDLAGVETVLHEDWAHGMASSLRVGVAALAEAVEAVIVMTCDQPAVTPEHLRELILVCGRETQAQRVAIASFYAGRNGVPACFPASMIPHLLHLEGDQGARTLLMNAPAVALPGGEVDVDTPESLEQAIRNFR